MSKLPNGFVNVTLRMPETLRIRLEAVGWKRFLQTGEAVSVSREIRLCLEEHIPHLDPDACPPRLLNEYDKAKEKLKGQIDVK